MACKGTLRAAGIRLSLRITAGWVWTPGSGLRSDQQEWTDERHRQGLAGEREAIRSAGSGWPLERHRQGLAGEREAIRYLQSRGWFVLAHRFRMGRTEIDLVARRGRLVAFIEVKARRSDAFGSPLEAVPGAQPRGPGEGPPAPGR